MTVPKRVKKATGARPRRTAHEPADEAIAEGEASSSVRAWVKKPQLTSPPRTPMMHVAARAGKRLRRRGGSE